MKNFFKVGVVILAGVVLGGCKLEGSEEFSCDGGVDKTLLNNPPVDTAYVVVESSDPRFIKTFNGIRREEVMNDPVEGTFENLITYRRDPKSDGGRLLGLGTLTTHAADSSQVTILFNLEFGTAISDVCRSSKVLTSEHRISRWSQNLPGAEVVMKIQNNGEWVTYSSDTAQDDDSFFNLNGAEVLDTYGIYARLEGSFSLTLSERNAASETPDKVITGGTFILNMQISE